MSDWVHIFTRKPTCAHRIPAFACLDSQFKSFLAPTFTILALMISKCALVLDKDN